MELRARWNWSQMELGARWSWVQTELDASGAGSRRNWIPVSKFGGPPGSE